MVESDWFVKVYPVLVRCCVVANPASGVEDFIFTDEKGGYNIVKVWE